MGTKVRTLTPGAKKRREEAEAAKKVEIKEPPYPAGSIRLRSPSGEELIAKPTSVSGNEEVFRRKHPKAYIAGRWVEKPNSHVAVYEPVKSIRS